MGGHHDSHCTHVRSVWAIECRIYSMCFAAFAVKNAILGLLKRTLGRLRRARNVETKAGNRLKYTNFANYVVLNILHNGGSFANCTCVTRAVSRCIGTMNLTITKKKREANVLPKKIRIGRSVWLKS